MQISISRQNDGQVVGRGCCIRPAGWLRCVWLLVVAIGCAGSIRAADPEKPKADLSLQQQQIRRDYERFERSLLEAAENMRRKEPEQSDILDRARQRSQEQTLLNEMDKISLELKQNQTGSASDRQRQVIDRMKEILQLLQSEDERDRLKREMLRIQDLLKDTNRVIGKQRDAKAANQKGSDQQKAEEEQKKAVEEAQKLANKIDKQDKSRQGDPKPSGGKKPEAKDSPSDQPQDSEQKDSPEGEQKPGDKESKDGDKPEQKPKDPQKPGDKKPKDEQPMPSDSPGKEGKDGEKESKPGKPSMPMDGQESPESQSPPSDKPPMSGNPMPSTPGQQPQSPMDEQQPQEQQPQEEDQQTQGRDDLKKAQESMQKAIEELEKKSRDAAGQEQERALEQLEKLKAKLEEILRQRREEEKELYLAMLEVRFQKMLRLQLQVNAETVRLEKIPTPERNPAHFDKCSEASRQQKENQTEADKTLNLLKEEGSSVAFPEAVQQMIGDMQAVAGLLGEANTGSTTQLREQMVLETLEEIILALQKEMEQNRQQKQQQQQKKQASPEDEKLVNQLAELKMIRSLQNQVNRVTKQLGVEIDGEQAKDTERRKLAEDLAKRQQRIQSATYDLSTGRNK